MRQNNPMSIDSWGPGIWNTMHVCSFMYPEEPTLDDKYNMYQFLHSLSLILPCPKCQRHFKRNLAVNMPNVDSEVLNSNHDLSRYIVDIHNDVNAMNGKRLWTHEDAISYYVGDKLEVCSINKGSVPTSCPPTQTASSYIPWLVMFILIYSLMCILIHAIMKKQK